MLFNRERGLLLDKKVLGIRKQKRRVDERSFRDHVTKRRDDGIKFSGTTWLRAEVMGENCFDHADRKLLIPESKRYTLKSSRRNLRKRICCIKLLKFRLLLRSLHCRRVRTTLLVMVAHSA